MSGERTMAFADPPYPGQSAKHYSDHPDYAGEVDHGELVDRLLSEYDGFCLHTASTTLPLVLRHFPVDLATVGCRLMSWRKPFAAFKRNVPVAYAWEPVIVRAGRKPVVSGREVMRDWLAVRADECSQQELDDMAESITLRRGLTGAKPERVCRWLFEVMGMTADDALHDLYPGSGAVSAAWETWRNQGRLAA
jgi:hypothetical protein